jgi:hypothetical protein
MALMFLLPLLLLLVAGFRAVAGDPTVVYIPPSTSAFLTVLTSLQLLVSPDVPVVLVLLMTLLMPVF